MGKKGIGLAGLACAAALAAAGCSSSGAPSAAAAARSTGPAADQVLVCHHYMTQRAWVRGLAKPTLADAVKVEEYVAADVIQSEGTGKLHADLAAMLAAGKAGKDIHALSARVYRDCTAIGVKS